MFKTSIELPDAGIQEREHPELEEMRLYLTACVRMGASLGSLSVMYGETDLTNIICSEIRRDLIRNHRHSGVD